MFLLQPKLRQKEGPLPPPLFSIILQFDPAQLAPFLCKRQVNWKGMNKIYLRTWIYKDDTKQFEILRKKNIIKSLDIWATLWMRASLAAHLVKNPSAMQETWVWSLGWEAVPEEGTATHSSILATENAMDCMGLQRVGHDWATFTFTRHTVNIYISTISTLSVEIF